MPSKFSSKKVSYKTDKQTLVCEVEKKDAVYILHMVNEDNRLRPDTITALLKALDEIEEDFMNLRNEAKSKDEDSPPAALVTIGNGHIYSNGLDFSLIMSGKLSTIDFFENYYHKLCLRVLNMPLPTVAAINGHAFAGGMMFAFSHDYKIMRGDRGYLCMPEVDLPGALTPGMMSLVESSMPDHKTLRDSILQGKRFSGEEAFNLGIIENVVSKAEDLLPFAIELASKWAPKVCKSPTIYRQLRLEMRSNTVKALTSGGLGFVPKM